MISWPVGGLHLAALRSHRKARGAS